MKCNIIRYLIYGDYRFKLFFIIIIFFSAYANWPVDDESYGLLGCKCLRFKGYWEEAIDSSQLDESTQGACLSIAMANILLYHKWPIESLFDGIYRSSYYEDMIKPIRHKWHYDLITGPRRIYDCETDDPEKRFLPENPEWTGVDEIHRLIYAVERSYGYDDDYFRTKDKACEGNGYYPIEHVLRNRFGYPLCKTIRAEKPGAKNKVIRDIQNRLPVIALKCQHTYIIDGYKKNSKNGEGLFHVNDYVSGEESMGWFTWKKLLKDGLDRVVVNISPDFRLLKGPSSGRINYYWGDTYVTSTSNTLRKGCVKISRKDGKPLGMIEIQLRSEDFSPFIEKSSAIIYHSKTKIEKNSILIPSTGTFDLGISETSKIVLSIRNHDKEIKTLRIVFHDFEQGSPMY